MLEGGLMMSPMTPARGEELPALANRVSRICFAAAVCIIMAELFRSGWGWGSGPRAIETGDDAPA